MENTMLPTVHPCKHANVLKTMADAMRENGQKVGSHFALFIFLKFITSVIPTVEFDLTGDLIFEWDWLFICWEFIIWNRLVVSFFRIFIKMSIMEIHETLKKVTEQSLTL